MKIKRFATKNWMGAPDMAVEPGTLTIISGRNGSGKTSLVEALRYCIGTGHDPSVVRVGEEAATVEILTDDGTTIKTRVTAKGTTRTITDAQGRKITRSAEWIASVIHSLSLDPVALISASPKAQMTAVLSAVPLRVTAQDLAFCPVKALAGVNLDQHALEVLGDKSRGVAGYLYKERAEINRVAKEKRATVIQLRATLPDQPAAGDWGDSLKAATDEYLGLQTTTRARMENAKNDANKAAEATRELFVVKKQALNEGADIAIEKIRAHATAEVGKCEAERDHKLAAIDLDKQGALKAIDGEYQPRFKALTEQVAQAKAMVEAETKARTTKEFIGAEELKAGGLETVSENLTAALSKLEALKGKLTSELPVPGLEITEDGLTLDGVPFQRVNKARQIQVALSVAKLQAGELGLIVVDDMEHLDHESFEAFRFAAEASGLQFVAAVVSEGDLRTSPDLLLRDTLTVSKV